MVGASALALASMGPSCDGMVRHDLADLVRTLGARCAGRACLTASTRVQWQEIADDVAALARHDEQRCGYVAAQRAARAMGREDVGEAVDQLLDLTGESADEWAVRVTLEMGRGMRS